MELALLSLTLSPSFIPVRSRNFAVTVQYVAHTFGLWQYFAKLFV